MKRWQIKASLLASTFLLFAGWNDPASAADKKYTIALIPGLTTDAFYITMHKGAQAAADALGVNLVFQGAPKFDPEQQVPVLNAVSAGNPMRS
jgi:ribose transport system substrate-binding protein